MAAEKAVQWCRDGNGLEPLLALVESADERDLRTGNRPRRLGERPQRLRRALRDGGSGDCAHEDGQ